jgi:hypothetical protein
MRDASLHRAMAALRSGPGTHEPPYRSVQSDGVITDLDVQELSINPWVQSLEVGVGWNHRLFESQDCLDNPGNTTCSFQVPNVRFDRATLRRGQLHHRDLRRLPPATDMYNGSSCVRWRRKATPMAPASIGSPTGVPERLRQYDTPGQCRCLTCSMSLKVSCRAHIKHGLVVCVTNKTLLGLLTRLR